MTGQEEIQYKTFLKFGLKDVDIREFFNGPAFLTWSRGQSMQSVGSSAMPEGGNAGLPRSWMQSQWELQKKILARTRPLGIIGVLPAFQVHSCTFSNPIVLPHQVLPSSFTPLNFQVGSSRTCPSTHQRTMYLHP
jgi:hypothetical protein